jgi:hypothetical protein
MLKSGRIMKGVVSHRDITPTLLSLLKKNFNIDAPEEVTWLNTALDTSLTFLANTFSPLQLINHTLDGIVYKDYLFCEGILEKLTDSIAIKVDDANVLKQMNRLLFLYQFVDLYAIRNDALIRNQYAFKSPANVIINVEDTIASNSHFAKELNLKVVEGPEKHKTTLYFDSSNLYIDFLRYKIPNDVEKFTVEIEFKIFIKNDRDDKFLSVVMELPKASKTDWLRYEDHNQWYTYKKTITYKKELLESDYCFKIYLWNNNQLKGYIDDIKVIVSSSN